MSNETDLNDLHAEIDQCFLCRHQGYGINKPARMQRGPVSAKVMLIGLAPGASASRHELAFAGHSFTSLQKWFREAGYNLPEAILREKLYLTSLNKCGAKPDKNRIQKALWQNCKPFLYRQLELVEPELILILGKEPSKMLLGPDRMGRHTENVGIVLTSEQIFRGGLFPPDIPDSRWLIAPHPSGRSRVMNDAQARSRFLDSLASELKQIDF